MNTNKIIKEPTTILYPVPSVMVSCGSDPSNYNIITIAWTGTVCSTPPMCYISVRPERHSHKIISKTKEFVINLTTPELLKEMDWCGVKSGRDFDKFKKTGLTPEKGEKVSAPIIKEAPVNIECKVTEIIKLGTHDMFLAEVVLIQKIQNYDFGKLIAYNKHNYYELGKSIGNYGFTNKK